jgi:FkbM family methyltransferase
MLSSVSQASSLPPAGRQDSAPIMPLTLYRLLFLLAYSNKFPLLSFGRHARMLEAARTRIFREHGLVDADLEGATIALDLRESVDLLCWIGRYERRERDVLRALVRPGATVVDAGAHIGIYTLLFSRWVGPGGRVEAFEPSPAAADRLDTNLRRNGCVNVRPHRTALADRETDRVLHVTVDTGYASLGEPVRRAAVRSCVPVPGTTLDLFCSREGIEFIDLLKMDIEGSEIPALRGAERLLRERRIGAMVVEYNKEAQRGNGFDPSQLVDAVRDAGYSVASITPRGLRPFTNDGSSDYAELVCRPAQGDTTA